VLQRYKSPVGLLCAAPGLNFFKHPCLNTENKFLWRRSRMKDDIDLRMILHRASGAGGHVFRHEGGRCLRHG
jgi:hypothetical protein